MQNSASAVFINTHSTNFRSEIAAALTICETFLSHLRLCSQKFIHICVCYTCVVLKFN
jgi:hypothetical protein